MIDRYVLDELDEEDQDDDIGEAIDGVGLIKLAGGAWCKWTDVGTLIEELEDLRKQNSILVRCLEAQLALPKGFKIEDIRLKDE